MEDERAARGKVGSEQVGFGPYESLRSLTDAGFDGMRDATRVFGGFVSMLESGLAGSGLPGTGAATDANGDADADARAEGTDDAQLPFGDARALIARLGDLYMNIVLKTLEASFDAVTARSRLAAPRLQGQRGEAVTLTAVANEPARGELFIHNHDDRATETMTLLATDLTSSTGATISARSVQLQPSIVECVPAGGTVKVEMSAPSQAAPGVFHGHVLVREAPEQSVPVRLVIDEKGDVPVDDS